ncbi:RluA family pseudouridine synthase [Thiomicrorhabdus sp.]|uniref:RluA family pseudouridine synthase n=1 Tax=Thiomicrorhabdus sp. TaxID=2039724 RepID=UPI0029C964A3|nr:RluA family pseudouridine synthase [Thiomicrorhabdus sp.]
MAQAVGKGVTWVTVTEEDAGQRLDNFLLRLLRRAPKSLVYRIVRKGEVRVNKGRAQVSLRLQVGDVVRIPPVSLPESVEKPDLKVVPAEQLRLIENSILYEDKDLMVVNKPSGVAVHGGSGLNWGLIEVLRQLRPLAKRMELVHRIDRDTSGCLLIAKKASVLKALHAQIRADQLDKRYVAIVLGSWPKRVHKVDFPLKKHHLTDGGWHVSVDPSGKEAVSFFNVEQHLQGCDLVSVKLKTGRTHQIRVHALAQGCPLLGDDKYGDREANKRYRRQGMKRLALHARFLGFTHPVTEERMLIEAPLWSDFKRIIEELALD